MKKPSLLVIFLTVFIDLIGFGIVLPLLPKYAEQFGAHGFEIGLIIGSYSLMQFFFAPMWGRMSDRIGRRPVILVSLAGSTLSYVLFAVAASFRGDIGLCVLLASRVFAGICGANLSVASAYIADVTSSENRSKGMGMIGMAFGLGFILGPAMGAFSASAFGLAGPGWVAASFCGGNFVLACFILIESRQPSSAQAPPRPKLEQWVHTLQQPKQALLIGLFFLGTFCFASVESTLPLMLNETFKYDEKHIGYLFAYCGLMSAFTQGGAIGRLVKRFGEPQLIYSSLIILGVSMAIIPYAPHLGGLLVGLGLFAVGSGINRPPTMGMISKNAPPHEQGATLGVAQSIGTLARIIAPVFATWLDAIYQPLPFLICAGIAIVSGIVAWQHLCPPKKTPMPAATAVENEEKMTVSPE